MSGPWSARPKEDKGLDPPQRSAVQKLKKKASTVYLGEIQSFGLLDDCFVLRLRGRRATSARSDDLFLICSPQEAMRDVCA